MNKLFLKVLTTTIMTRKEFLSLLTFVTVVIMHVGLTSCSKDDSEYDSEYASDSNNKSPQNGFIVSDIGMSYITIKVSLDDLKRLYLEGLGITNPSTADLSKYGLDNDTWKDIIADFFYIRFSPDKNLDNEAFKVTGEKDGNMITFEYYGCPNTTYYYQIYQLNADGQYKNMGEIYSVTTKEFNRSAVNIITGDASTYYSGLYKRVQFEESVIQINGVNNKENIWCGILHRPTSREEDLHESNLKNLWYDDSYQDLCVINLSIENYSLSSYAKLRGFTEIVLANGQVTAKLSPTQTINTKGTYYYCVFVMIGGEVFYAGEVKSFEY